MFWLKFQGDPETDEYRCHQSKYFDKTVTTLWSAIEVAELTGKTAQKMPPRDPERKPGKGGSGKGGKAGKGKTREKNQPCWLFKNGQCKYGKDCIFNYEDSESKGASVRQVLLDELVDSSTEVTTPMTMQGQVEEGWIPVQPKQTYRAAVRRLARVLESTGGHASTSNMSKVKIWRGRKRTTRISGCWRTLQGVKLAVGLLQMVSNNISKVKISSGTKSTTAWGTSCRCTDSLQMGVRAASRLKCAIAMGSSAASRTAIGEMTNKVSTNSVDGGGDSAQHKGHYSQLCR